MRLFPNKRLVSAAFFRSMPRRGHEVGIPPKGGGRLCFSSLAGGRAFCQNIKFPFQIAQNLETKTT
jgi:hypothetical protein